MFTTDFETRLDGELSTCVVNVHFNRDQPDNSNTFWHPLSQQVKEYCQEHSISNIEFNIDQNINRTSETLQYGPSPYERILMETFKGAKQVASIVGISGIEHSSHRTIQALSEFDNLTHLSFYDDNVEPQYLALLSKTVPSLTNLVLKKNWVLDMGFNVEAGKLTLPEGALEAGGILAGFPFSKTDGSARSGLEIVLENFPRLTFLDITRHTFEDRARDIVEAFRTAHPDRRLDVIGL